MNRLFTILFTLSILSSYSQENVRIIVPHKFQFQKKNNEYQLNELTKFLFEKKGFQVFFENNQPQEVTLSPCENFIAEVINDSGIFSTRLYFILKDCTGKEVFKSETGSSREKEFKKSYHEALRDAFDKGNKLAQFRREYSSKQINTTKKEVVQLPSSELLKDGERSANPLSTLYAKPIPLGFELTDVALKVVLKIKKTSLDNIYIAQNNDNQYGILYLKGENYVFEYEYEGEIKQQLFLIKFY